MTFSDDLSKEIERLAASSESALIWDEDAVERRAIAVAIHERSLRKGRPFVRLEVVGTDDASFAGVEARLFGHERNAFSSATEARPGLLEKAKGGSILIDDVAALDLAMQWLVFSSAESKTTRRIGGTDPRPIDVRFILATAAGLPALVKEGRFREDLFRKISRLAICVPPTRDLHLEDPIVFEKMYVELSAPRPCLTCFVASHRFRQLRDGYLVCAACGGSFATDGVAPAAR